MQWEIQMQYNQTSNQRLVKEIIESVLGNGFEFGVGPYPGRFSIIGPSASNEIHHINEDSNADIEKILSKFSKYEPSETSLTIYFARSEEPYLPFELAIIPRDVVGATLVSFKIQSQDIHTEAEVDMFLDHCGEIFASIDFSFGGYSDEYDPSIPESADQLIEEDFRPVVILSSGILKGIADNLDSREIKEIQDLSDGNKMVLFWDLNSFPGVTN